MMSEHRPTIPPPSDLYAPGWLFYLVYFVGCYVVAWTIFGCSTKPNSTPIARPPTPQQSANERAAFATVRTASANAVAPPVKTGTLVWENPPGTVLTVIETSDSLNNPSWQQLAPVLGGNSVNVGPLTNAMRWYRVKHFGN